MSSHHLNLLPRYLGMLQDILEKVAPEAQVWAFGSRVTGQGHDASDIDLVMRDPRDLQHETRQTSALLEALVDSNLPLRVDVVDWARIPDEFRQEIERAYVVLRKGQSAQAVNPLAHAQ
ncbi:MAG: nucleotidyltransferase domain-containing protein [Oxalobacteraceae bacterium]|nr:nucleotidyltransferase domain-containing protein [Oxalobacteraceae bacterium]